MRKEDLKNWTRDMLKDRIMELEKIVEQWKCDRIAENLRERINGKSKA